MPVHVNGNKFISIFITYSSKRLYLNLILLKIKTSLVLLNPSINILFRYHICNTLFIPTLVIIEI